VYRAVFIREEQKMRRWSSGEVVLGVGHLCHNLRATKNVNACIHGVTARRDSDGSAKPIMGQL
jgi:hypothetical protein